LILFSPNEDERRAAGADRHASGAAGAVRGDGIVFELAFRLAEGTLMDGSHSSGASLHTTALATLLSVSDAPTFDQIACDSHALARRIETLLTTWESTGERDPYAIQVTRALLVTFLESLTNLGRTR
jgi:hypothetical protein